VIFGGPLPGFDLRIQLIFFFGAFANSNFRVVTCFQLVEDASLDFLDSSKLIFLGLPQARNLGGEPLFPLRPLLFFGSSLATSFFQRAQATSASAIAFRCSCSDMRRGLDLGVELLLPVGALRSRRFLACLRIASNSAKRCSSSLARCCALVSRRRRSSSAALRSASASAFFLAACTSARRCSSSSSACRKAASSLRK